MSDETLSHVEALIGDYRRFAESRVGTGDWRHDFGVWLQNDRDADPVHLGVEESVIGMHIVTLHNLTRSRMNKLINSTPLANIMDYQFLLMLDAHGRQRKSDLIAGSHMEMSSGIEVVRRLLKNRWIDEEPNPEDKRSKFVSITTGGRELIAELKTQVDSVYGSFCEGLDGGQRAEVLRSLELLVSRM